MQQHPVLITRRSVITVVIAVCLFMSSPATYAYGGHHYGYHHGYYGGHVSYHSHGHGDAAGYVILGVLGGLLLAHIFDRDDDYRYPRRSTAPVIYNPPPQVPVAAPARAPVWRYVYSADEGWNKLVQGDAGHALDIFAIQSQQNLDSGQPRIGFALAAAAIGETDRAIRAMRKAVSIDPQALHHIQSQNNPDILIDFLSDIYKEELAYSPGNTDTAFMAATLAYLKQDYTTASNMLSPSDQSPGADNLRQLIRKSQN